MGGESLVLAREVVVHVVESLYFHVYEHQDWATHALVADSPAA